jgi:hypothetical protein
MPIGYNYIIFNDISLLLKYAYYAESGSWKLNIYGEKYSKRQSQMTLPFQSCFYKTYCEVLENGFSCFSTNKKSLIFWWPSICPNHY